MACAVNISQLGKDEATLEEVMMDVCTPDEGEEEEEEGLLMASLLKKLFRPMVLEGRRDKK